jgi:hypothetical protein
VKLAREIAAKSKSRIIDTQPRAVSAAQELARLIAFKSKPRVITNARKGSIGNSYLPCGTV